MTVVKSDTEGTKSGGSVLGDSFDFVQVGTLVGERGRELVHQNGSSESSVPSA